MIRLRWALPLLAVSTLMFACGDDGDDPEPRPQAPGQQATGATTAPTTESGPSAADDKAIRAAVTAFAATGPSPCGKAATAKLIAAVNGPGATCDDPGEQPDSPDDLTISDIEVDGDAATAVFGASVGGDTKLSGGVSLVRSGATWKVDALREDFFRGLLLQALPEGFIDRAEQRDDLAPLLPAVRAPQLKTCLGKTLDALPAAELQQIGYDAIDDSDRDSASTKQVSRWLVDCLFETRQGSEGMRTIVERGIRRSDGVRRARDRGLDVDCLIQRLRGEFSDQDLKGFMIARLTGGDSTAAAKALRDGTASAAMACG